MLLPLPSLAQLCGPPAAPRPASTHSLPCCRFGGEKDQETELPYAGHPPELPSGVSWATACLHSIDQPQFSLDGESIAFRYRITNCTGKCCPLAGQVASFGSSVWQIWQLLAHIDPGSVIMRRLLPFCPLSSAVQGSNFRRGQAPRRACTFTSSPSMQVSCTAGLLM